MQQSKLALIVIDLAEGFTDDTVVIHLGSQEIYHRPGVSTNWLMGIADSFTIPRTCGLTTLTVAVLTRNVWTAQSLFVAASLLVVIALKGGQLQINSVAAPHCLL